jgi:hypothetical protein
MPNQPSVKLWTKKTCTHVILSAVLTTGVAASVTAFKSDSGTSTPKPSVSVSTAPSEASTCLASKE